MCTKQKSATANWSGVLDTIQLAKIYATVDWVAAGNHTWKMNQEEGSDGVNEHNTTQIIYLICSNGCHGYNYFQVQKDAASFRGRPLNRLGVVPIRANMVLTYIYIYCGYEQCAVCFVTLYSTVIHTSPFCWDSRNHKLFYKYAFALSTPKKTDIKRQTRQWSLLLLLAIKGWHSGMGLLCYSSMYLNMYS